MRWGIIGCKPQTAAIIRQAIAHDCPPSVFITLPGHEQADLVQRIADCDCDYIVTDTPRNTVVQLQTLDLLIVCRYNLLEQAIFQAPKLACLNVHSSLLPNYRGVHPVSWALIRGEQETGVTIHHIDSGIDTGPIVLQGRQLIRDDHTIHSLTAELNALSADMVVALLQSNNIPDGIAQAPGDYFYAKRRRPEDGLIDFNLPANAIFNLIRALQAPLPFAFYYDADDIVTVSACELVEYSRQYAPGTHLANNLVQCQDALLRLTVAATQPRAVCLS